MNNKVKKMCIVALMAGLSLILDYLISFQSQFYKLSLYAFPLIIIGLLYGPKLGLFVGLIEGLLNQFIQGYITPTLPLWILASTFWGFFSGLFYNKVFKNKIVPTILLTSIIVTITNSIVMILDGLILNGDYTYVFPLIIPRLITSILMSIIYILTLKLLLPKINKITI